MVSCIIVDDEDVAREGMRLLVEQVNFLELKGVFSNAIDADRFLKLNKTDLLFLDIHMPKLSGMDYLRLKQNDTLVIFTTAYADQAVNAFENGAVDYLLKPIRFERFYKAVMKATNLIEGRSALRGPISQLPPAEAHFFIKHERKIVRFNYAEILFIEGLKDYCLIHTNDKKIDAPMNLKTIEKQLPSDVFIRVSKSHIINFTHISLIEADLIQLKNHAITLSPLYKNQFYARVVNKNFIKRGKGE